MCLVYADLVLWIFVFFKVSEMMCLYFVFGQQCGTRITRLQFVDEAKCIDFDYFCNFIYKKNKRVVCLRVLLAVTIPPKAVKKVCGAELMRFCQKYVLRIHSSMVWTCLACAIIIVGHGFLLMASAAVLGSKQNIKNRK